MSKFSRYDPLMKDVRAMAALPVSYVTVGLERESYVMSNMTTLTQEEETDAPVKMLARPHGWVEKQDVCITLKVVRKSG